VFSGTGRRMRTATALASPTPVDAPLGDPATPAPLARAL
jgi:hypothetical protein